ncbi:multidrug effflux MFS transporter [uncultured Sphingomonas sp.]|uniref:multidrug effflux MFS transporter n=1 Tax=uncultured Sphingomonas sp. TaxID=158754 RepID=UPI0025F2CF2C|nr:multidrug effflux MFS transporter [uncultured Sphingomonas sp.]
MPATAAPGRPSDPGLRFGAFVTLIASLMAVTPLGIDAMLPALPDIGRALNVDTENHRQWVIAIYVLGFGSAQLVYGPLSDSYGRKPLLVGGLVLFTILSIVAGLSTSFPALLAARLFQGIAGAAGRVLVVSVVRDCFAGRQMARVMSISFMIFLAVPIFAPSIGQGIMLFGNWRLIFFFLAGFAALIALMAALYLRETLHPQFRRPIAATAIADAVRRTLSNRNALGYTLALSCVFGALMGFINSIQQIFTDIFHAPARFPLVFACIGIAMGIAAYTNSRVVERLGTRKVSHSALIGMIVLGGIHTAVGLSGYETMLSFTLLQSATMFCFGLLGSNFGSMAMEEVGEIAGTASSIQGFVSTCGGALLGLLVGQSFNGTTVPLTLGFLLLGGLALLIVFVTERGHLFQAHRSHAV